MTDTPTPTTTDAPVDAEVEPSTDGSNYGTDTSEASPNTAPRPDAGLDPGSDRIKRYLAWGALGVCSLLAVFALIQFYGSATDAIDLWVEPKYQPLMRAAFNLAVLLASLIGVSLLVRELSEA